MVQILHPKNYGADPSSYKLWCKISTQKILVQKPPRKTPNYLPFSPNSTHNMSDTHIEPPSMNDIAVQHAAGVLGLARLNHQEARFVEEMLRGVPLVPAAKAAGFKRDEANEVIARPHVAQTIAYLRDQYAREVVRINRDMLNMMLLEAHGKAATATEEIMAIRELGKMNGCYEPEKREVVTRSLTYEQVQQLDTDELLRLAEEDSLDPEIEDAEWEEMDE